MTDGSSQGLFVIVAVVIFGIFISISYLLFRDKLQIGLASIFDDSIETTKGQLFVNPNLLAYSDFSTLTGWTQNSASKISLLGNNELLIEKDEFTERRGGLFLDSENLIRADLNQTYSASIEIYIESYVVNTGYEGENSTFYIRTTLNTDIDRDFGNVDISKLETGKWIRLEINGKKPNANTKDNQSIQYSISIDKNVKAKIRVRKPKLEIGKEATVYTNY